MTASYYTNGSTYLVIAGLLIVVLVAFLIHYWAEDDDQDLAEPSVRGPRHARDWDWPDRPGRDRLRGPGH